ncbi:MAG: hypothetical protein CEN91_404 [Candidatus Berkelbacteria bacterium Licking1014_85]|uniref:Four helix bundle protein n=1 Tax=Candidatus Berkelbacteria bacterium Licking1014_85 TaxID=2017148 RepID=A0A554LI79_9BACT|nr:MAG: hypothetical protein CEN91_404 [Candidatus Berkelbacteria bacterium Licking1014_85]
MTKTLMNDKIYDLEKRTLEFSKMVIALCRIIPKNIITIPLISQLIRSATSIGANYSEANAACSKADFKNKIYICKKELKETLYWLEILLEAELSISDKVKPIFEETKELIFIFSKIISSLNSK